MLPSTFGLPLLRGKSRSVLVVSRHLDSLLHTKLADLLHSALNHGVRYVSIPTQPVFHKRNRPRKNFPATHFIPLEEYPSPVAVSCHHNRYPLAVVESCSNAKAPKTTPSRLQGFTPLMNSQCCHVVSNTTTPDPSMGFVPLQDPQFAALHKTNLAAKSRH